MACAMATPPPSVAADCAFLLEQEDLLDEAEIIFHALEQCLPTVAVGYVGKARIALRKRAWQDALTQWDLVINRFPHHANARFWQGGRARALLRLGQAREAERIFCNLLAHHGEYLDALLGLISVLTFTGEAERALTILDSSTFGNRDDAVIVGKRLDILLQLRRADEARAHAERLLARMPDAAIIETLFNFAPRLYDRLQRHEIWQALLDRLEVISAQPHQLIRTLKLRLLLALRRYDPFLQSFDDLDNTHCLGSLAGSLRLIAATLREQPFPNYQKMKVFGIGLSKTGTTSLGNALRRLGLHVLDWDNFITRELISEVDVPLFEGFTDIPLAGHFEEFYQRFERSRFIYTTRPVLSWKDSMLRHWRRNYGLDDFLEIRAQLGAPDHFAFGQEFSDLHRSLYFDHAGFEQAYRVHDERVRRFFRDKPTDRFLEFDVFAGDGWQKLCNFLGKPIPDGSFPMDNVGIAPKSSLNCP